MIVVVIVVVIVVACASEAHERHRVDARGSHPGEPSLPPGLLALTDDMRGATSGVALTLASLDVHGEAGGSSRSAPGRSPPGDEEPTDDEAPALRGR